MISKGIQTDGNKEWQWVVVSHPDSKETENLIGQYGLMPQLSDLYNEKEIAMFHPSPSTRYPQAVLIHLPLWEERELGRLAEADRAVTLILSKNILICFVPLTVHKTMTDEFLSVSSLSLFVYTRITEEYRKFCNELERLKKRIEKLEQEAREKSDRKVLLKLASLEQEIVILSRRLDDYEETLTLFLNNEEVTAFLDVEHREIIRLKIKKAGHTVHLYKELVESTSGLLSDSIDNKLNSIMEYLASWALVISIPTLIFSLFGINTGGLIGRDTPFGSWLVIALAVFISILAAQYLKKKDFK